MRVENTIIGKISFASLLVFKFSSVERCKNITEIQQVTDDDINIWFNSIRCTTYGKSEIGGI